MTILAVRAKVASGEYATESEVIRHGLRALLARDQAIETWLKTEVAAAEDTLVELHAYIAGPLPSRRRSPAHGESGHFADSMNPTTGSSHDLSTDANAWCPRPLSILRSVPFTPPPAASNSS